MDMGQEKTSEKPKKNNIKGNKHFIYIFFYGDMQYSLVFLLQSLKDYCTKKREREGKNEHIRDKVLGYIDMYT